MTTITKYKQISDCKYIPIKAIKLDILDKLYLAVGSILLISSLIK